VSTQQEILKEEIQQLAQLPFDQSTLEVKQAYLDKLQELFVLALSQQNGCTKEAKESLEYFADIIGITPKLITVAQAGEFGVTRSKINNWIRAGVLKVRGRQKSPAPGGGRILVAEADVLRLVREAPGRGRSWSSKKRRRNSGS